MALRDAVAAGHSRSAPWSNRSAARMALARWKLLLADCLHNPGKVAHPRCAGDAQTLQRCLRLGWVPERAIAIEVAHSRRVAPKGVVPWAIDGEDKSLYQWAHEPQRQVIHTPGSTASGLPTCRSLPRIRCGKPQSDLVKDGLGSEWQAITVCGVRTRR